MSATWTVPGLIGPGLGAAIAATFGWRWAFDAIVAPALAACLLTYPPLRRVDAPGGEQRPLAIRWPIQVAAGAGLIVLGLTSPPLPGLLAVAAGVPLVLVALRHTLPAGSLLARPGLPSVVAAAFFLNTAFYAASAFVPLLLTRLRDVPVTAAGVAVSAGTIAWSAGVWLNTLMVDRFRRSLLLLASALLLALGTALFATALTGAPLPLAYGGWILAGFGMGICFNTFTLNAMVMAPRGGEGAALGGRNLTGSLGTAMGTGVGGAAVAFSSNLQLGLPPALAFVYGMSVLSALATAALARRSSPS
jgi:predicted MFS family arabinose efflux permease